MRSLYWYITCDLDEKNYFLIFYYILNCISNYCVFLSFNILSLYCVYSHCLHLHKMTPCTISIKDVQHGWISQNSTLLNMSASIDWYMYLTLVF